MFNLFGKREKEHTIELDASWQELLNTRKSVVSERFLNTIKVLNVFIESGNKIETLDPLLSMSNLEALRISRTFDRPVDIRFISQLKQLKALNIAICDVSNVGHLHALNHLKELNIQKIDLKTKDLSCLSDFENLKFLNISGTKLRSLIHFQNNNSIETLVSSYSKGLKNMHQLKNLFLLLRDNIEIDNCPNIELIRISKARKPQTLEGLIGLKKLKALELFNNEAIIDLGALHKLESLEMFFLNNTLALDTLKSPCPNIKTLETTKAFKESFKDKKKWLKEYFPNARVVGYQPKYWGFK